MTESESIVARIEALEAHQAIGRLITDLGQAFDTGPDPEALRRLFSADALFRIDQYGDLIGADGIADGVAGNANSGFRWTLHYLVSPRIDRAADRQSAKIEFMLWEPATAASGRSYWIAGSYAAEAAQIAGAWRFTRLELKADLISHYPEGWHDKPAALDQA